MATFGKESVQFSWVHMVRKLQAYCWRYDYPLKHQPTTGETIFNSQTKTMIKIAQMARLPTPAGIYVYDMQIYAYTRMLGKRTYYSFISNSLCSGGNAPMKSFMA